MSDLHELKWALGHEVQRLQPAPGLESRVLARTFEARPSASSVRSRRPLRFSSGFLKLVAAVLALTVIVSFVLLGRIYRDSVSASNPSSLTAQERIQLAELEGRPFRTPVMPADGSCRIAPTADIRVYRSSLGPTKTPLHVYGDGPVYMYPWIGYTTQSGVFDDDLYFTDSTVSGPVLIRAALLDGGSWLFFGRYAYGPVLATATVEGKKIDLQPEAVLRTGHAANDPLLAPGWSSWHVGEGYPLSNSKGCAVIQIDTLGTDEVLTIAVY